MRTTGLQVTNEEVPEMWGYCFAFDIKYKTVLRSMPHNKVYLDISSIHNALRIFINVACLRFPVDILQSLRSRLSE